MNPERGRFIVFEGGEGSGKTTQVRTVAERLRALGIIVASVREPGGTPVGDHVRKALLDRAHSGMSPMAELFLYEASRAEHVASVIGPRLAAGDWVLCDRFAESSLAYQGYGRGIDLGVVRTLNGLATGDLVPDHTILLDVDPVAGLARATGGGADRLEAEDLDFHERVRAGFLELAKAERHDVIDANAPTSEVAAAVWDVLSQLDGRLRAGR